MLNAQPLTDTCTNDDYQERTEQYIHTELLKLWFVSAENRANEQTGRQPCSRDPKDAELCVPTARYDVGQIISQRNPVKTSAFDSIVCRDHSHQDLKEKEQRDCQEIFDCSFL